MDDLPDEVWLLITDHFSDSDIFQLMGTNRALLNIALDRRYRSIEWVHLDNNIVKYLERLQDPFVAGRVRRLHVRAWFLQYLLRRERLFGEIDMEPDSPIYNITKRFSSLFHWSPSQSNIPSSSIAVSKRLGKFSSSKEIIDAMVHAISLMVNVTEFKFNWDDLTINSATRRLLSSTGQAFSSSLGTLILHGRISQLSYSIPFANFYQLDKLILRFEYDPGDNNSSKDDIRNYNALALMTSIVPFINSLSTSLRCLSITSFGNADHSPFLDALGPFPMLQSLALHISFTKEHLSKPGPIHRLLKVHKSTLEAIEVCPHPPGRLPSSNRFGRTRTYYPPRDPDVLRTEAAVGEQMVEDPVWPINIRTLSIPAFEHLTTCRMLRQISRSCLRNLSLKGRYMALPELQEVLMAFGTCDGLDTFSVEVVQLSANLIQFLAHKLSYLRSLTLVLKVEFDTILTRERILLPEYHTCQNMDWTLYDLSIYLMQAHDSSISASPETQAEENLMRELKTYILPNLKSFKGRGHMKTGYLYLPPAHTPHIPPRGDLQFFLC
ncbi:hypothetical protein H0H92_001634 [Tricholoma furcatifolium]|nr:hypothetical protein H0H92_001634 [Tricholoma furcatifolium]